MLNVSDTIVQTILAKRPFVSPKDFLNKVNPNKQAMISLIKGGAFDSFLDRRVCMAWYIWETCDKKKRITLQNLNGLNKYNLLPTDTLDQIMARRVFEFNRYLKGVCKYNSQYYKIDNRAIQFLSEIDLTSLIKEENNIILLDVKQWDKHYQSYMDIFRDWIAANKKNILQSLNEKIFKEDWDKYATGNISSWEMEVLCFYYHDHELKDIDMVKYGFSDFATLPPEPVIEKSFVRNGKVINLFKLYKICGTCIAKNKTKSTVTLLTTSGVVNVKFRSDYFSLFDKQISQRGEDGIKHVIEKSWFNRGNMIIVMGIRSGDDFIVKKYNNSQGHQLYKIKSINKNNDIELQTERCGGEE